VDVSDPTISDTVPHGTEPMVTMVDIAYQPDRITVQPGDTISFVHDDPDIPHTVTARDGSFESGQIEAGETFTVTVQGPGEIPFYCQIHPDRMQGVIEIVDSG
jgi:plastocyanin